MGGSSPNSESTRGHYMASGLAQQQSRLKELISRGREQGYLTYSEVNDHLPDEISDPDQIEDIIGMMSNDEDEAGRKAGLPGFGKTGR